jgi:hypothetical protein
MMRCGNCSEAGADLSTWLHFAVSEDVPVELWAGGLSDA